MCRLVRYLFPVLLATSSIACVAADDELEDTDSALTVAQSDLAPMAEKAKKVADSLGTAGVRAGTPTLLPLPGGLASTTVVKGWKIAGVLDAEAKFLGYMLLPQAGAPAGSFAIVLVDPSAKVVALSAYVPDGAKEAEKTARKLLDAVSKDADSLAKADGRTGAAGSVTTKGLASKLADEGIALATRLLTGLGKGKPTSAVVQRAEAHLAPKVESQVWRQLEAITADRAVTGKLLADVAAHRLSFGSRRVIAVEVSERRKEAATGKTISLLQQRYGGQTKKVGLALRDVGANAEAALWALKNDVPIVVSTMGETAQEALERMARGGGGTSYAHEIELIEMARDPKKLALVRVLPVKAQAPEAAITLEHQEFVPIWSMADEALGVRFAGETESSFLPWLQRFELSTVATF